MSRVSCPTTSKGIAQPSSCSPCHGPSPAAQCHWLLKVTVSPPLSASGRFEQRGCLQATGLAFAPPTHHTRTTAIYTYVTENLKDPANKIQEIISPQTRPMIDCGPVGKFQPALNVPRRFVLSPAVDSGLLLGRLHPPTVWVRSKFFPRGLQGSAISQGQPQSPQIENDRSARGETTTFRPINLPSFSPIKSLCEPMRDLGPSEQWGNTWPTELWWQAMSQ